MYPGTKFDCFGHSRVNTLGYPDTKPGCFGHTRICTRAPRRVYTPYTLWGTREPNLVVLVILGYVLGYPAEYIHPIHSGVPGYQTFLCWSYSGTYPGTPQSMYPILWGTRVPNLVVLGLTWVCARVPPGTKPSCFGQTWVCIRVSPEYITLDRNIRATWPSCWRLNGPYIFVQSPYAYQIPGTPFTRFIFLYAGAVPWTDRPGRAADSQAAQQTGRG